MKVIHKLVLVVAVGALLTACGSEPGAQNSAVTEQGKSVQATKRLGSAVTQSTNTETVYLQKLGEVRSTSQFAVHKDSLEKEYLLRGHAIPQNSTPTGSGLKSRIVAFRKYGNSLYMLQSNQGHLIADDLPQELILAEFPILREEQGGDLYVIDFNTGMRNAFVGRDWWGSDYAGVTVTNPFQRLKAAISVIPESSNNGASNYFRQLLQTEPDDKGNVSIIEFNYVIEPYQANPDFKPFRQAPRGSFRNFGYFESQPLREPVTGKPILLASKWDVSKPIVFHISANTPEHIVPAVREGILYWNRAFGRDVVQVKMAPKGVTAPAEGYNMVQWVKWDNAGFAYADANVDPRSGEIKQANVYMTSAFATDWDEKLPRLMRELNEGTESDSHQHSSASAGLDRFRSFCQYNSAEKFDAFVTQVLTTPGLSEEQVAKVRNDYVMEVIAHEVGHTLGLRHNFAASLATNLNEKDRQQYFNRYVQSVGRSFDTDIRTTSSMMEYNTLIEGNLMANLYTQLPDFVLDYDRLAIENLYIKKIDEKNATLPLFCTDSGADKVMGCARFDYGDNFAHYKKDTARSLVTKGVTSRLLSRMLMAKTRKDAGLRESVQEYPLSAKEHALAYGKALTEVLELMRAGTSFLKIEKAVQSSPLNLDSDRAVLHQKYLEQSLFDAADSGNLAAMINSGVVAKPGQLSEAWMTKAESLLGLPPYSEGFSGTEKELIKARLQPFYTDLEKYLATVTLHTVASGIVATNPKDQFRLQEGEWMYRLEDAIAGAVTTAVTATSGEQLQGTFDGKPVTVPQFTHQERTRKLAKVLLSRNPSLEINDWLFALKPELKQQLEAIRKPLAEAHKDFFSTQSFSKMSRPLRQWAITENAIFSGL